MLHLKFILFLLVCIATVAHASGSPTLEFADSVCDMGYIAVDGGKQQCTFMCVNTGDEPMSIVGARSSCGCTVPSYPTEPILPGKTALITVTYDPAGRPIGEFRKTITIVTTGTPREITLYISGEAFSLHYSSS